MSRKKNRFDPVKEVKRASRDKIGTVPATKRIEHKDGDDRNVCPDCGQTLIDCEC